MTADEHEHEQQARRPADPVSRAGEGWRFTVGLGVVLAAVTLWALPDHVQAGDAGELATIMLRGGVPHPSGYPWMRILGLVARPLEALGVPPATAAALPCATAGVAGWLVLQRIALHLSRSALAASLVVGLVALGPRVLVHTADSEVWGPLVLATAVVAYLVLVRRAGPFGLGLAIGLTTSHHLTGVLLLPLVIGGAWPSPTRLRSLMRAGGLGLLGAGLGLLPYATLMIGSGGAWRWGRTDTLAGLLHHVSRADYGVLSLSLHTERPEALDQWARVSSSIGGTLTADLAAFAIGGAGVILLVLGIAAMRRPAGVPRPAWSGLLTTIVGVVWLFVSAHNIDPTSPFGAWILERFDIMGVALLTLPTTVVVAGLLGATDRPALRWGLGACGGLLLLRQIAVLVGHGPPSTNETVERYAHDVLRTPEPGRRAIVFGTDDHRLFPMLYVQEVLGKGHEVLYVDASLLAHGWYRERLERRFEGLPTEDKPLRMMAGLWDDPRWRDTPIFVANLFSRPAAGLPRVPQGVLWRVIPPDALPSGTLEPGGPFGPEPVLARHLAALARYPDPLPTAGAAGSHPFAADLAATYTEMSAQLATALLSEGRTEEARALLRSLADRTGSDVAATMPRP